MNTDGNMFYLNRSELEDLKKITLNGLELDDFEFNGATCSNLDSKIHILKNTITIKRKSTNKEKNYDAYDSKGDINTLLFDSDITSGYFG